jgi:secondary thiamine-phosphate synthase enzyme
MRQFVDIVRIPTPGRGLVEITPEVVDWLRPHDVRTGLLTLFCRHTSSGLLIQENASREVRVDLEAFFDRLAPEEAARYRHADEGGLVDQTKAPALSRTSGPFGDALRLSGFWHERVDGGAIDGFAHDEPAGASDCRNRAR